MIKQKLQIAFIFTIILTTSFAQTSINQFDKDGKRHGLWTKNYHKTNQKRYEGVFHHGKEIDSFKYYTLSGGKSVLSAVKFFKESDSLAEVTFLTSSKKVISKGKMNGKRFVGEWIFYHKNSSDKMIVEYYNSDGKLDGERTVYYKNGLITEKAIYKNGRLNGEAQWFTENNDLYKLAHYKDDELDGKTITYDGLGQIVSEGNYKGNQKIGIWKYYKNGKLNKEIDFTAQEDITKQE